MRRKTYAPAPRAVLRMAPLLAVFLIGAAFRFWRLTDVPPALSHDESAIAYNAYSLLETGRDEYGASYPLLFRSFDDYKLPGMVYSTVPAVAAFGKTEAAARLPSAVYGSLSVVILYLIAAEALGHGRLVRFGKRNIDAAILPAFMLAVSAWHINFSRQLFESNGAVFWFLLGTLFLLRSRKRYADILPAGLSYVAALYFYYSVRLVIPFIVLWYALYYRRVIWKEWRTTVVAVAVSGLAFLPLGKMMVTPGGLARVSMVSVANDPNYVKRRDAFVMRMGTNPGLAQKIIYNRRTALVITAFENFAKNVSYRNLFVSGTGTYGALHTFELPLIIIGFAGLFALPAFTRWLFVLWGITAFLPGALSVNQPNTLRTLVAAPFFAFVSGLGIMRLLSVRNAALRTAGAVALAVAAVTAYPVFMSAYFTDNPTNNALSFADGQKQMVSYVTDRADRYPKVYVTGYYWRPYVFFLYWGGTDPLAYQTLYSRDRIGNVYFASAPWDSAGAKFSDPSFDFSALPDAGRALFVLSPREFELHADTFDRVSDIDGRMAKRVFVAATLK